VDGIAEVLKSGDETLGPYGLSAAIEVIVPEVLIAVPFLSIDR
jgi:hypothetical protein